MFLRLSVFCILLALAGCGSSSPLPDMQRGEVGRVVRIIDGDALVLDTGQSVRLASIEGPVLRVREGEPDVYAKEAARALEDLTMGRQVRLYYPGLTRDRYDRALAHIVTEDGAGREVWVNMELVRTGATRVRLYPDTDARGDELLRAETEAREANIGIWKKRAYKVRKADRIASDFQGFIVLSAELDQRRPRERGGCTWSLRRAAISLEVYSEAASACDLPSGTNVRLRGYLSDNRLRLEHPLHTQVLE
ncbi:MAG: thermonuclease family protein [Pseudomonadota bacterium]